MPRRFCFEFRLGLEAGVLGDGAAGVKVASYRRVGGAGHVTLQDNALALLLDHRVGDGYGRQQRLRVGMQRTGVQRVAVGQFDDLAQVHHRHPVADVAHHSMNRGMPVGPAGLSVAESYPEPLRA